MKKRFIVFVILLAGLFNALSQNWETKPLYPNGIPHNKISHPQSESYVDSIVHPNSLSGFNRVYSFVNVPEYSLFPADKTLNKGIGLVIYPGGGFKNIWLDKEGTDIALWLSKRGVNCMVVKYRTNRKDSNGKWEINIGNYIKAIQEDASASVLLMKEFADSLNIDKNKIGTMGFSAGGWLAESMVFKYHSSDCTWNPAFTALIYHGNKLKLFEDAKDKDKLPPFFMAVAETDEKLSYAKIAPYLKAIATEVKQSELHVYPDGRHGFGLGYDEKSSVSAWKNEFISWLDKLFP